MDRLLGLSPPAGTIKMGTTLADHFSQLGGKHSILRNADGYNARCIAQPTATRMDIAAGAFDS